jgi:hypothetical protein
MSYGFGGGGFGAPPQQQQQAPSPFGALPAPGGFGAAPAAAPAFGQQAGAGASPFGGSVSG